MAKGIKRRSSRDDRRDAIRAIVAIAKLRDIKRDPVFVEVVAMMLMAQSLIDCDQFETRSFVAVGEQRRMALLSEIDKRSAEMIQGMAMGDPVSGHA